MHSVTALSIAAPSSVEPSAFAPKSRTENSFCRSSLELPMLETTAMAGAIPSSKVVTRVSNGFMLFAISFVLRSRLGLRCCGVLVSVLRGSRSHELPKRAGEGTLVVKAAVQRDPPHRSIGCDQLRFCSMAEKYQSPWFRQHFSPASPVPCRRRQARLRCEVLDSTASKMGA